MKISGSNSQMLKELSDKLKRRGFVVTPLMVSSDKDDKGVIQDIVQFVIENPEISQDIIELTIDELKKLYDQEHIYVVKKNGERISYEVYKQLSSEERSEYIF